MTHKLLFLLFCWGLLPPVNAQILEKYDLNGPWEYRQTGTSEWFPASVPGCIQLDLMHNQRVKDPFYRTNEDSVQWVSEKDWEYHRIFMLSGKLLEAEHIDLVLEGLDTYADVYLNDSLILSAGNMFRAWECPGVKQLLKPGRNELRVNFKSVIRQNTKLYNKLKYKLPGDEKIVCRKAAYNFGWDWGPKLVTMGIWKPVYLRFHRHFELLDARFIQKKIIEGRAEMSGVFTFTSDQETTLKIKIDNDSMLLAHQTVSVKKGRNLIRLDFVINNPKLWWPNGMGAPFLYSLNYYLFHADEVVGKGRRKIGLRTIELKQEKDSTGTGFTFFINHVPVFAKGANYIPQDNFPSRVSDSSYRELLEDAKDLNMNMLRVWGGGIYEKDVFYDLCDELGIMVWQDFMYACAMYPGTGDFLANADVESAQNIIRLRNHPCLVLWCGNNEIDEGWKNWGWVKQYNYSSADSALVYQAYKDLFNGILPNNVEKMDTLRPYISTSPHLGWGNPGSRFTGDMHYWGVWWGRYPFSLYKENTGRFMSEYGFQAFPDISSIRKFAEPGDMTLGSDVMKAHQKNPVGYETIDEYMIRDYRHPKDFESYVYVSQVLQAEGIKMAIEDHRRAMPVCMGTLFWQFNDCWPVVSWSARDYYGTPKALHYFLQKEYRDILVSTIMEKDRLKVYIVSDRKVETKGSLNLKVIDFKGKVLRVTTRQFSVPGPASTCCFNIDSLAFLEGVDLKNAMLEARFTTSDLKPQRYSNTFYFVPVKDLSLEKMEITSEFLKISGGYKITLKSDKLAKNVWLNTGLKGRFSDNYFDLLPGEPVEIFFFTSINQADFPGKIMIRSLQDTYNN
ncbi:MAG: glycoside hydrolase family 2 protein [Bacteroidetes bacterium]|nr:glycoside hydrolase family 2 protein [Bacteroidota bacterium]